MIKIAAPLLIMAIIGIIIWIAYLMKLSQDDGVIDHIGGEQGSYGQARESIHHRISSLNVDQELQVQHASVASPQPPVNLAMESRRYDPETPLPPTMPFLEVSAQQAPINQRGESIISLDTFTVLTVPPSSQISQPAALPHVQGAASTPLISLHLLKDVSMHINVPGGGHVVVPLTLNAKRVQLLVYIA